MNQSALASQASYRDGLPEGGLRTIRGAAGRFTLRKWNVVERGQGYVPESGPVIFASNHTGWLDGPLMFIRTPRDVHALVKSDEFEGKNKRLLQATSQIPVARERVDTGAMRKSASALSAGQAIGIFPEGTRGNGEFDSIKRGIGYLALVSGAPIVPMAMFGTRDKGAAADSRPATGARIDIVYGRAFRFEAAHWPRTAQQIDSTVQEIQELLQAHLIAAKRAVNRELPGDLPFSKESSRA